MPKAKLSQTEERLVAEVKDAVERGARLDDSIKRALNGITGSARRTYLWGRIERKVSAMLRKKAKQESSLEKMFGRRKAKRMRREAELLARNAPPSSR